MLTHTINPDDWLDALHAHGCRVTAVQELLVHIFAHAQSPLSAEQAWEAARQSRPETGRATVYRTVEKLEGLGLVRRVHGYKGCSHFVPVMPAPVLVFICLECGHIDYLDREPLNDLIEAAARSSGHRVTESRLQTFGICAQCLNP